MEQSTVIKAQLLLACAAFVASPTLGQTGPDTLDRKIEEVCETALETSTRDIEDSQFAEMLFEVSQNPISLNNASESDLQQIPGINPILAGRIVAFRERQAFTSIDELLLVDGVDRELFRRIRGFFTFEQEHYQNRGGQLFFHYTGRTIRDLQVRRGFRDGTYLGNPYRIYNKIIVRYIIDSEFLFEAGGLTEKDPGEKDIADFSAHYVSFATTSKSLRCILGDFVVEAGQGLVLWRTTGTTKGSEVIASVTKNPRGLQAYASSDENGFFRGGAFQASIENIVVTGFVSRKSINANLNEQGFISSFDASGLSRTRTEIESKSSSGERLAGFNVEARVRDGLRMGLRAYTTRYDHPVALSTLNGFRGQYASIGSIDFAYASNNVGSFAEVAMDYTRSVAGIGGVVFEPVPNVDVALVAHSYPRSFVSLHGFGFGESGGQLQNSEGIYTSARLNLCEWLTVSTYYDQFTTPGASATSLLPTDGHEFLGAAQLEPNETMSLQLQVKQKNQTDPQIFTDEFSRSNSVIGRRSQSNYRISLEWSPSSRIRWRSRFEYVRADYSLTGNPASGFLIYQDMRVKPMSGASIDGRIVVFDTDSYDSRIYEYESELRGTFVNPALFGKGIRLYILSRYDMGGIELSAKYSCTRKAGVTSLGSGTGEIIGDTDNQLSVQVDITL